MRRREFLSLGMVGGLSLFTGCREPHSSAPSPGHEFLVHNRRPKDLETPVEVFRSFLTPTERFFLRSHHPEPTLSPDRWQLTLKAPELTDFSLGLADLKEFKKATVTAVLQCAGNSRSFYRPRVAGVQWGRGAVGNAQWGGIRLADLLAEAGVTDSFPDHVVFRGADKPLMATVPVFERELPLSKCLHPDTLLAYEMNGQPLPRLHGGPVRLVVPGWVGDDWIKWVNSICIQSEPCASFYFQKGYRYPKVACQPGEAVAPEQMEPMTELSIRSLFTAPAQ